MFNLETVKSLSNAENRYYFELIDNMDSQLAKTINWLGSNEAAEMFSLNQEKINEFFNDSDLREELILLSQNKYYNYEELINKFYEVGSKLGYQNIGEYLGFTEADGQALLKLTRYNFDLIKNINTDLRKGIRGVMFEGVAGGYSASKIARMLYNLPHELFGESKISLKNRCKMIARTEHARAINTGTIQSYFNSGVTEVNILTAGDELVCEICLALEDYNPYPIAEAMDYLPVHPNCRCSYTPVTESMIPIYNESDIPVADLTNNPQLTLDMFKKLNLYYNKINNEVIVYE